MKIEIPSGPGIASLFGTRDENLRFIEQALGVRVRLERDNVIVEGEPEPATRIQSIIQDFFQLGEEGVAMPNAEIGGYLRVLAEDPSISLRGLIQSGRQRNFGKKLLAPKTLNQRRYLDAIERHGLVFGVGPAGTGKTYLAVAMAVSAYLAKKINRIILTRPAVEAGERLGFLPGTLQEKIDPYLRPLYDSLFDMIEGDKVEKLMERQVIEVAPLAFMRGRTLNDAFIILDEAQNTTPEQMKMALTRIGFNSKMVVTGDLTQVDLPHGKRSGLQDAIDVLHGIEEISFVRFDDRDVVRHALVQSIVRAYDRFTEIRTGRQLSLKLNEDAAKTVVEKSMSGESTEEAS
jgi:phosphate starvation-inducible protein PhoH and related proteins